MIINRDEVTLQFEGKTDAEAIAMLDAQYNISIPTLRTTCKYWFANVFTYCSASDLEDQLNDYLWFINFIVLRFTKSCFNQEDTVSLGCVCPCGNKQTILYFTLTPND